MQLGSWIRDYQDQIQRVVRAGLEPGITGSQGKRPNNLATLPPPFVILRNLIFKRQRPPCVLASIKQTSDAKRRVDPKPRMPNHDVTYESASLVAAVHSYFRTRRRWNLYESFHWRTSKKVSQWYSSCELHKNSNNEFPFRRRSRSSLLCSEIWLTATKTQFAAEALTEFQLKIAVKLDAKQTQNNELIHHPLSSGKEEIINKFCFENYLFGLLNTRCHRFIAKAQTRVCRGDWLWNPANFKEGSRC